MTDNERENVIKQAAKQEASDYQSGDFEQGAWWALSNLAALGYDIAAALSCAPTGVMEDAQAHAELGARAYRSAFDAGQRAANPAASAQPEPFAYYIYVPHERRGEFVHDLDDAIDDLTNCECEITDLFDQPPPVPATLTDAQCDEFRRLPLSFNDMVRAIYRAGRES